VALITGSYTGSSKYGFRTLVLTYAYPPVVLFTHLPGWPTTFFSPITTNKSSLSYSEAIGEGTLAGFIGVKC
jgi:hypothetical protein